MEVTTSTDKNPEVDVNLKYLSFCDRYACGNQCEHGQVTRCVAAAMASLTLRLFPVTVVTVLVALVSSSGDHEWHFNPGRMSFIHMLGCSVFFVLTLVSPPKNCLI